MKAASGNATRGNDPKTTTGPQPANTLPALRTHQRAQRFVAILAVVGLLGGCAVVTVASTAATLVVGTVGMAADVAIGAARVTGKAIGTAASAVTPSSDEE